MTLLHHRTPRIVLAIAPLDEHHARSLQTWNYPDHLQRYNFAADPFELQWLCHPRAGIWQITDTRQHLFGFAVIGQHAQVAGGTYHHPAQDVLIGLHPQLLNRRHGYDLARCVSMHAHHIAPHLPIRVSVPSNHLRALRIWQQLGLFPEYAFLAADGTPHVVLVEQSDIYTE